MRKIDLELKPQMERPLTTSINTRVQRPESTRAQNQKIFRMSVANFKPKRTVSDMDHLISPPGTYRDKSQKFHIEDLFAQGRSSQRKFVAPSFNPKQPGIRIVRYNTRTDLKTNEGQSPLGNKQFDFISIKASGTQQNFHKKSLTTYQRPVGRSPTMDIYSAKLHRNPFQTQPDSVKTNKAKISFHQQHSEDLSPNGQFYVNVSGSNFEEDATECTHNTQSKQANSISDSTAKGRVINFSSSISSQNTLMADPHTPYGNNASEDDPRLTNFTNGVQKRRLRNSNSDAIKIESIYNQKNFKTVDKITEAKEKAKIYNDQLIKQYQFNKQSEEEEMNFLELCDVLNTHL